MATDEPLSIQPDHVAINKRLGFNLLTMSQFRALPLSTRTQLIMDRKVAFLANGEEVSTRAALSYLRGE